MTAEAPKPIAQSVLLEFCRQLGYDPKDVAEIELVQVEPRQVTVTVRPALDRRAVITYKHPVE